MGRLTTEYNNIHSYNDIYSTCHEKLDQLKNAVYNKRKNKEYYKQTFFYKSLTIQIRFKYWYYFKCNV